MLVTTKSADDGVEDAMLASGENVAAAMFFSDLKTSTT
jgi:hypothetical protein